MSSWLLPCNAKFYDIEGVYKNLESVDWKQSVTKVEVGDIAYIYVSAPVGGIAYKCVVEAINKPTATIDDLKFRIDSTNYGNYGRYMQLKFIASYDTPKLSFEVLSQNGLKGRVMCQRCMDEELENYVENTIKGYTQKY